MGSLGPNTLVAVLGFSLVSACLAQSPGRSTDPAADSTRSGNILGVTRGPGGTPLPLTRIVVTSFADGSNRTVTSDEQGAFAVPGLKPGRYQLKANKGGYVSPSGTVVEVAGGQSMPVEIALVDGNTVPVVANPPGGFFKRFFAAYAADWKGTSSSDSEPKYRGYPAPESNPPYPFAVWPIGGTPWIGYPGATSYPLTTALQTGPHGDWWKKANIQIYGWLDVGANLSTSHDGTYANAPAAYPQAANSITLDQATLYVERVPDTVQKDHFDWGFRLTNLYGFDYRFTTASGYFSQQLLNNPKADGTIGNKMGYDPVMAYVDLYFPKVADGMDVRIGRYISLPDIEAQLAPNNYTYTHSLTYTYDCYTQTGINATVKLNNHWTAQAGLSGGCESSPWSPYAKLTGNLCLGYTWQNGGDNVYVCANSINDGKYSYNNLAGYYATWYHKFGTSPWHMAWETWYQYERQTPNVNNPASQSQLITNANGAYCDRPDELTCFAPEWATVHYLNRQLGRNNFVGVRNEYFDDIKGQRTGFKTRYSEHGLYWNRWVGSTLVFRPELRFEHAYDAPAYDSGMKKSQLMLAADVIVFF
ncbi:MAG TPA: TonB-dependent receptor [Bryobacteraceae bacterium]|nr:TonB-dependent receptor [Bryobacteraceae bacterium]